MSQTPTEEPQGRWHQPPFAPGSDPADAPVVSGSVVVPGEPAVPASAPGVAESMLNVVIGVIWPVAILLGVLGVGAFMMNVLVAIISSIVLGQVAKELKRRRIARALGERPPELR
ncbi:MAG TPA: hypothetical protein PKV13_10735 [Propionicimonas sp.]|nr:hypothetical protein [Propionicimonas sp.]